MDTVEISFSIKNDPSGEIKKILIPFEDLQNLVKQTTAVIEKSKSVFGSLTDEFIRFNAITDTVSKIGESIAGISAPAFDFNQRMADLSAITGVVGEDLDRVSEMARRVGKESGLGASEAARAFSILAGQLDAPVDDIGRILERSATLATAADLTIDDAANSLAATISQYGLAADEADRVMNVLAAGSRVGASEVVDLAQSFKVVGASASNLGLDVEHTAGALEVLAGANIKGAEAGTALRNILLRLNTKLGVDTNVTELSDALAALQPQLKDTEFLARTFGVENVTAATYLIQNADAVREMTAAVTDTQAAQEQAAIRSDTWASQMSLARAAVEDFKISIGSALGPIGAYGAIGAELTPQFVSLKEGVSLMVSVGQSLVSRLVSVAGWLGKTTLAQKIATISTRAWGGVTRIAGLAVGGLTGGLGRMRAAIMRTTVAQRAAAVASKVWAVVQAGLNVILNMNPIGLIVLGITALIGVVYGVVQAFKRWGDEALLLFGPLGSMILAFKTHWDSIVEAFKSDGIIGGIRRIGQVLMDVLLRPVQKLLGWVAELTGWDWAKKAATWVQEVRVENNLATDSGQGKTQTDPATGKPVKKEAAATTAPAAGSLGIGAATKATAAKATSQAGQIKRIDITIDKVVESFTVSTTNLQQSASEVRDMVARALVDAVNDVNYAL